MWLDSLSIPGLRKDFEQLVIWEEIETWECCPLGFEVILQTFLDLVELPVAALESLEKNVTGASLDYLGCLFSSDHDIFPELVNKLELFGFRWELLLDILSIENVFQVHPWLLEYEPLINAVGNVSEFLLPCLNIVSDLGDILRAHRRLNGHLVILKLSNKLIDFRNEKAIFGVSVGLDYEEGLVPDGDDWIKSFQNLLLSTSKRWDNLNFIKMGIDTCV